LSIAASLRGAYQTPQKNSPILDDRSYLALWSLAEHQNSQNEAILAQARLQEQKMWAALRGEDFCPPSPGENMPAPEPNARTLYAQKAWKRLAAEILGPDDIIYTLPSGEMEK
jgi:hypothetical protein